MSSILTLYSASGTPVYPQGWFAGAVKPRLVTGDRQRAKSRLPASVQRHSMGNSIRRSIRTAPGFQNYAASNGLSQPSPSGVNEMSKGVTAYGQPARQEEIVLWSAQMSGGGSSNSAGLAQIEYSSVQQIPPTSLEVSGGEVIAQFDSLQLDSVQTDVAQTDLVESDAMQTLQPIPGALQRAMGRRQQVLQAQASGDFDEVPLKNTLRTILRMSMFGIMIVSLVIMSSLVLPEVYYRLFPENVAEVAQLPAEIAGTNAAVQTDTAEAQAEDQLEQAPAQVLPPFDPTLPTGTYLRIPSIGVDTQLEATLDPNEALERGAWLVPDFGRPDNGELPIIAAAHRFGWDWWWQSDFGRKHSFYSLPKLTSGDQVEIIYDQRKYIYTVYNLEEGELISDYSADLILYTCKFMNSPERYFTYANRDLVAEKAESSSGYSGEDDADNQVVASEL